MAGTTRPTVEGAPELQRAFRKMGDRLTDLEPTHTAAATVGAERARQSAPRRSGALIDTIRVEADATGATVVAGSPLVPYAGVINYGWPARNIEAQPYLSDGADDAAEAMVAKYVDKVDDVIRVFDREAPP